MRKKKQVVSGTVNERPKRGAAAAQRASSSVTLNVFEDLDLPSPGRPSAPALQESVVAGRQPFCPSQPNLPASIRPDVPEFISKDIVNTSPEYQSRLLKLQKLCDAIDAEVESRSSVIRALTSARVSAFKAQMDLQLSKFSVKEQNMPLEEFLKSCPGIDSVATDDGKVHLQRSILCFYPKLEDSKRNLNDVLTTAKDSTLKRTNSAIFTPHAGPKISAGELHTSENMELAAEQKLVGEELSWPEYYMQLQSLGYKPGLTPSLGSQSKLNTPMNFKGGSMLGVTPKTLRLPKHGEAMLSINGSPLGQFGKTPGTTGGSRITRTQTRLAASKRSLRDL